MLDVDRGYGEAVLARLRRFLLRSKVELETLDWRDLSLRGDGVAAAAADEPDDRVNRVERASILCCASRW